MIRWQPTQSERDYEVSQATPSGRGVCARVVLRVQSKLSRAFHAHRGKELLQDLQILDNATMKRERYCKGAIAFDACLGILREATMEGSLWRETFAWDRMTMRNLLVEWIMAMVAGKKPPAFTLYHAHRMEFSYPHRGCSTRHWLDPSARSKFKLALRNMTLSRERYCRLNFFFFF